jgi:hypothetical protein
VSLRNTALSCQPNNKRVLTFLLVPGMVNPLNAGLLRVARYDAAMALLTRAHPLSAPVQCMARVVRRLHIRRIFGTELCQRHGKEIERLCDVPDMTRNLAVHAVWAPVVYETHCTMLAMDTAAVAVTQPDGNVTCFMSTGRQCAAWLSLVHEFLDELQHDDEFTWVGVSRVARERDTIRSEMAGTANTISAHAVTPDHDAFDNMRGMGTRLWCVIFCDVLVKTPVLLPLLANGASLVVTGEELPKDWGGGQVHMMNV